MFSVKDQRGNVTKTIPASEVKIREVSAGKNHCLCLEDWKDDDKEDGTGSNRVFSWG